MCFDKIRAMSKALQNLFLDKPSDDVHPTSHLLEQLWQKLREIKRRAQENLRIQDEAEILSEPAEPLMAFLLRVLQESGPMTGSDAARILLNTKEFAIAYKNVDSAASQILKAWKRSDGCNGRIVREPQVGGRIFYVLVK